MINLHKTKWFISLFGLEYITLCKVIDKILEYLIYTNT